MADRNIKIFTGNIIHCSGRFQIIAEQGFVIVENDKVIACDNLSTLTEHKEKLNLGAEQEIKMKDSQFLMPGLVDTHIHAPQYPNVGLGYDKPLLDWLEAYTYKIEKKFKDLKYSEKVYDAIVAKTLSYGTTTACYFASLYEDSSMVLVNSVIKNGQRALVGKINMITLAPDDYKETREESISRTRSFVQNVLEKNNNLVQPIVTPRFALSVDMDLMKELSKIAKVYDLHIQSHISENKDEVAMVQETYKTDYATAYDRGEMLTPKTVLAHGVYLSDAEVNLLKQRGTSVSHCPCSNTLLKSGMCDLKRLVKFGLKVGLGTDVSGGSSASVIDAMRSAIYTSIHLSHDKENYTPLTYDEAFYLGTLGGAEALSLEDKIGNFKVGKQFDALIVDMDVKGSSADYLESYGPLELLQKFVFLGDDRNVIKVYVDGKEVK